MNGNYSIKCDVLKCKNNAGGCNCRLETVKITCGKESSARCGDYEEK